jgi:hypothetical protein
MSRHVMSLALALFLLLVGIQGCGAIPGGPRYAIMSAATGPVVAFVKLDTVTGKTWLLILGAEVKWHPLETDDRPISQ